MCDPVTLTIAAATVAGLGHHSEEQAKKANRQSATTSLHVQSQGLVNQNTEQQLAAQTENDNYRRQANSKKGEALARGVGAGLGSSSATQSVLDEYGQRQHDLSMATTNRRSGEMLAMSEDQNGLNHEWANRMQQNESSGPLGYVMAMGTGAMNMGANFV